MLKRILFAIAAAVALGACANDLTAKNEVCRSDDWYRSQRDYCDPNMPQGERETRQAREDVLTHAREQQEEARKRDAPQLYLISDN